MMKRLLLRAKLDIEPVTWGVNDAKKREKIRQAIKKTIPEFDEQYMECLLKSCDEVEVILNCYLTEPIEKDIDNLAKIPIDAVFFSAQNEKGYKKWEGRITSLKVEKFKNSRNALEIILYGASSHANSKAY
jgi:Holliday junction resolvase RusA-like endonuclease